MQSAIAQLFLPLVRIVSARNEVPNSDIYVTRDEYGAIFIIFTIKEMMKLLHLGNKKINKMLKELEVHNLIYRSHQGLGKPNKIYVYDLLKADNGNWLPKQFKHRKGRTNEKEIL